MAGERDPFLAVNGGDPAYAEFRQRRAEQYATKGLSLELGILAGMVEDYMDLLVDQSQTKKSHDGYLVRSAESILAKEHTYEIFRFEIEELAEAKESNIVRAYTIEHTSSDRSSAWLFSKFMTIAEHAAGVFAGHVVIEYRDSNKLDVAIPDCAVTRLEVEDMFDELNEWYDDWSRELG